MTNDIVLKNFKSSEPCLCCGHDVDNEVTYHHEYGQKAFPEYKYKKWNLVSLCATHHGEIHTKGSIWSTERYPNLKRWFIDNDWTVCELMEKWIHDLDKKDIEFLTL